MDARLCNKKSLKKSCWDQDRTWVCKEVFPHFYKQTKDSSMSIKGSLFIIFLFLSVSQDRYIYIHMIFSEVNWCTCTPTFTCRSPLVKRAIHNIRRGKTIGLDEFLAALWKRENKVGLEWLPLLFKMPKEWKWSIVIPLYKNKCDTQNCNNYKGIKLLSHTMKVWVIFKIATIVWVSNY